MTKELKLRGPLILSLLLLLTGSLLGLFSATRRAVEA